MNEPNSQSSQHAGGTHQSSDLQKKNARSGAMLGLVAVGVMLGAPVLYFGGSYLCNQLGVGYNPNNPDAATVENPDGRTVTVTFASTIADNLPVRFWPEERQQEVTLGESVYNVYHFKNTSSEVVRFRPIHSMSPPSANRVYSMTVCFCFNDQEIEPGGERTFEVEYSVGADLDFRVSQVHVGYSLHEIDADDMRPHIKIQAQAICPVVLN